MMLLGAVQPKLVDVSKIDTTSLYPALLFTTEESGDHSGGGSGGGGVGRAGGKK